MKKLARLFLNYVVGDRKTPAKNRERVGQNLMILAVFMFFVFIINFVIIVGTDRKFGVDLSKNAKKVYQQTVKVQAKRGTIYDRNGNAIAEDATTYSVYAIISKNYTTATGKKLYVQSSQYDKVATILNEKLGIDKSDILKQLNKKKLFQVSFGTSGSGLSYTTMTEIKNAMKKEKIEGIGFSQSPGRLYPNGIFASQFIGFTSSKEEEDGTKLVGTTGVEASLNSILSGTDGQVTYEKDKNGNVLLGTATKVKQAVDGKDVYTTLSEPIQTVLETQMDVFQAKTGGVYASATVVNAKTGEILATSQRPTYNPQTLDGYNKENLNTWSTLLYQSQYEPGSTMKVMTVAAAIDSGNFSETETYFSGEYKIADSTIKDWDVNEGITSGLYMTFPQGFAHSSNVGMVTLEQKMGQDKWLSYLSKFKFGYPTRFGMKYEDGGLFPSNNIATVAQTAFGQGIGVTQAQMLRAFTAISNNGVMLEPQFISKIYDPNSGTTRSATSEIVGKPVSKTAASKTRDYMVAVGTDSYYGTLYASGSGPVIQVGNASVAVKSGTAQIAASAKDGGGYLQGENDTINSAVAMVPSDDPDFIMYVTVQQPQKFSITNYSDIFNPVLEQAEAMKETLQTPVANKSSEQTKYTLTNVIGKQPGDTAEELRRNLVQPVVIGNGSKITKTSKKVGSNLAENEQILLLTNKVTELPDMYGWTKKNVKQFAKWTGIKITYKGKSSGKVTRQSVDSGTDINKVKKLKITIGD